MKNSRFKDVSAVISWMRGHTDAKVTSQPYLAFGKDLYHEKMGPVEGEIDGMKVVSAYWVQAIIRFPGIVESEGVPGLLGSYQTALLPVPKWPEESAEAAVSMFGTRLNLALDTIQFHNDLPLAYISNMTGEMLPSSLFVEHWNTLNNYGTTPLEAGDGEEYVIRQVTKSHYLDWLDESESFRHPLLLPNLLERVMRRGFTDDHDTE